MTGQHPTSRPGLLGLLDLSAELAGLSLGESGPQRRPDLVFLERDVITTGTDELAQQRLEVRIVSVRLVEPGQHLLALLLLADSPVGELAAAGQALAHGRPEVHFLRGLVPGLLDDQSLGHLLAQRELVRAGACGLRGPGLELGRPLPDYLMGAAQYRADAWPAPSRFSAGRPRSALPPPACRC